MNECGISHHGEVSGLVFRYRRWSGRSKPPNAKIPSRRWGMCTARSTSKRKALIIPIDEFRRLRLPRGSMPRLPHSEKGEDCCICVEAPNRAVCKLGCQKGRRCGFQYRKASYGANAPAQECRAFTAQTTFVDCRQIRRFTPTRPKRHDFVAARQPETEQTTAAETSNNKPRRSINDCTPEEWDAASRAAYASISEPANPVETSNTTTNPSTSLQKELAQGTAHTLDALHGDPFYGDW